MRLSFLKSKMNCSIKQQLPIEGKVHNPNCQTSFSLFSIIFSNLSIGEEAGTPSSSPIFFAGLHCATVALEIRRSKYLKPPQYSPFKISYNTHKDKWSINELLTMCVQEEEQLLIEQGGEGAFTIPGNQRKNKPKNKGKGKVQPKADIKKESTCFFCKKKGHMKKDCVKHKVWLEKKGISSSFVCYESNFINANHNTLWIDSGSTIYVSNTL